MRKKFAWSYSALTGYETCPKQYWHLRVARDVAEKPSHALSYGNYVHKALENRVASGKPLPSDLSHLEGLAGKFSAAKDAGAAVSCELSIAFNADLDTTEYFARDVWLRCKLDVVVQPDKTTLKIYDYKTGKRKFDTDQLKLFAAAGFAAYPDVQQVDAAFIWLNTKQIDKIKFTTDDEPLLWQEFQPRVDRMAEAFEAQYFPPRPSGLCRGWCAVKTCEYWEPKHES